MEKVYGSPKRQDGLYKVGRNSWELIFGFGEDENGGWNWRQRFNYQPTIDEILNIIKAQIDVETDERIIHGLQWNGQPVTLDNEAQTNILGILVNLSLNETAETMFPMTFKLGDNSDGSSAFYEFKNAGEFALFAKTATDHKQTAYADGWAEKVALKSETFNPQ